MKEISSTLMKIIGGIVGASVAAGAIAFVKERTDEKKRYFSDKSGSDRSCETESIYGSLMIEERKIGVYEQYLKRPIDCTLATGALICFSPILLITGVAVRIKLGFPVLFIQPRPGIIDPVTGKEKIFRLYKFRSMTDEKDGNGVLLPDSVRLTDFGKKLRNSSLDELPELINIVKGDMAVIGPRPQLVRDMVFMTNYQRQRHTVRPGLSGLAQVNGRNGITWEEKLEWDQKYLKKISFFNDVKLIFKTIYKTGKQEGISDGENATVLDFGDALLKEGKIDQDRYDSCQAEAKKILKDAGF